MKSLTKHCSSCNKCIEVFDHHCIWLNNCIGKKNYFHFLILIAIVLTFSIYISGIFSYGLYVYYRQIDLLRENIEDIVDSLKVICISNLALSELTIYLAGKLLGFHLYLIKRGITTYQYIVEQMETEQH